jgi:AcrR family transcriptional regulator
MSRPRKTAPPRRVREAPKPLGKSADKPARDRILDAAEQLFAEHGFDGVTMRQIMGKAGRDVALAYYHFKSKRDLFDAVILRRVGEANRNRLRALEEVERRHGDNDPVTVEEIISDFVHPLFEHLMGDHEHWRHYFALIAQINNSPKWGGEIMTQYFDPLVKRFLAALRKAMPGCSDEDLYWAYEFFSGALTLAFAETGRIDNLSGGLCKSADMAAVDARLPRFIAAGFRALCEGARQGPETASAARAPRARRR